MPDTQGIPILTAFCLSVAGLASTPAMTTPNLTVVFDGTFVAFDGEGSFADANEPLGLGLTSEQAEDLDEVAGEADEFDAYGTFFVLNYGITPADPSPATPRNWVLDFDFGFEGTLLGFDGGPFEIPFDEALLEAEIGTTFPITGIQISELTGPFALLELADLGLFIASFLSDECMPAGEIGPDLGACLFAPEPDLLSGLIAVGLSPDFTEELLFDILELGDVLPDGTEFIDIDFAGELVLRAVPEPGTLTILTVGLIGFGFVRRRRLV